MLLLLSQQDTRLEQTKTLLRNQIQLWRQQKRTWAWIQTQPAARAYYDILGGK